MSDVVQSLKLLFDTSKPVLEPKFHLQWCIMPEAIEEMRTQEVVDPYLFIVIVDDQGKEQRELVPLDRMQKLVQFNRPGKHEIHARIVWNNSKGRKGLIGHFLARGDFGNSFRENIWNGRMERGGWKPQRLIDAESVEYKASEKAHARQLQIRCGEGTEESLPAVVVPLASDVVIPEEEKERRLSSSLIARGIGYAKRELVIADGHFAKEPPQWVRRWVNFPYETKPIDQCQFRKRLPFAILVQPFLAAIFFSFTITVRSVITLWFWLLGLRGVEWKRIFQPFAYNIKDVARQYEHASMNFSFAQKASGDARRLWGITMLFTPIVPAFFFLVTTVATWASYNSVILPVSAFVAVLAPLTLAVIAVLGTIVVLALGVFFTGLGILFTILFGNVQITPKKWLSNWWSNLEAKERENKKKWRKTHFAQDRFAQQFESLVCDGRDGLKPISAIPASIRRTPILLFEKAKYRVCKPSAR